MRGISTFSLMALAAASRSIWEAMVEPPRRMAELPAFSALSAVLAASAGEAFSGSISVKWRAPSALSFS